MLLDTIERCYFGFRRRRRDVRQATSCECNACSRIPDLDLKFVVHHGIAILQKVAGRQELLGSDVIVVHRLLKNEVVERLGIDAYALISQACIDASDLDPAALGMRAHTETYDRIGDVPVWVARPRAPLAGGGGSRARLRLAGGVDPHRLGADERAAAGGLGVRHQARAADELAAMGDGGDGQGGDRRPARTRVGQSLHARQGRGRRGDPGLAPVRLRHGPDDPRHPEWADQAAPHRRVRADRRPARRSTSGYAPPRTQAGEGAHEGHRAGVRAGAGVGDPSLVAQLDAELAAREADRGPEPELPRARCRRSAGRASSRW